MNLPHIKYIQALLCGKMPLDDILIECQKWSFPFPVDADMNQILDDLRKDDPEFFNGNKDRVDRDIIDNLEVTPMVVYKFGYGAFMDLQGIEGSFKLLENHNIRSMLYAMFLADMSIDDIELTINEKFDNLNSTTEAIQAFKHYYFNLKNYSYKDKQELEKTFISGVSEKRMFRVALKGDTDYLLWKFNAAPKRSLDSMLKEMLNDSFYLFKEKAHSDADVATRFGALALKLADKIDRIQDVQNKADDLFADLIFESPDPKKVKDVLASWNPPTSYDLELDTNPVFMSIEQGTSPTFEPPVNSEDLEDENRL